MKATTIRRAATVLTLQQIVLSKNGVPLVEVEDVVLTLQQIVLSKNDRHNSSMRAKGFDFTTNCSF